MRPFRLDRRALPQKLRENAPWLLSAFCLTLPWAAQADREQEARYPYDPACAWGRIANGKGMLHRCLSREEAELVAGRDPTMLTAPGSLPPKKGDEEGTEEPKDQQEPVRGFTISVGPIEAEEGEVALGALGKPMDRYRKCVETGGGLTAPEGKVVVRFLVRAERSRAEGTEVDSFQGVSKNVARCIADIVDRRRVGTPNVPLTGTKLTFLLQETP